MTSNTPRRKSGLPLPAVPGILGSNRKSKLQTPQSRRIYHLSSHLSSKKVDRNRRDSSTSSAGTPYSTLEAAKRSLNEPARFLTEKRKSANDIACAQESENRRPQSRKIPSSSSTSTSALPLYNEEAVKVGVRIRPLLEANNEPRSFLLGPAENTIVRNADGSDNTTYHFNHVYGETSSTKQLYDDMISDIVESVVCQGRNGTVFTYGQTSTGKTFTMHGILMAAGKDLFGLAKDGTNCDKHGPSASTSLTTVKISCMELYNEELRDLLNTSTVSLSIQEDRRGNVQITNLLEKMVNDIDELMSVIQTAEDNRTVESTTMNERSSRSHTIFKITYDKKEKVDGFGEEIENKENGNICRRKVTSQRSSQKVVTTVSTLNLVDLAGSESVRVTGAKGKRQKEGGKINQSLLTLSRVLAKLGNKDRGHINYRDSKLTRILKPALSGNARMGAICCISPSHKYFEETRSTLDFASRTMLVTTNAKSNQTEEYDDALVEEFKREIERVKMETARAEESRLQLEKSLQDADEQIICLRASIEAEKGKVFSLERQKDDHKIQVEELKKSNDKNANELTKKINELEVRNQQLEANMTKCEAENTRHNEQQKIEHHSFNLLAESRLPLQFASQAKIDKTITDVNEIMADRSQSGEDMGQTSALEEKTARASRKAEESLRWIKKLILNGTIRPCGMSDNGSAAAASLCDTLFVHSDSDGTAAMGSNRFLLGGSLMGRSKRRYSDSVIIEIENSDPQLGRYSSTARSGNETEVLHKTQMKSDPSVLVSLSSMTGNVGTSLLHKALATKSAQVADLRGRVEKVECKAKDAARDHQFEQLTKRELEHQISSLVSDTEFVLSEQDIIMQQKGDAIAASLKRTAMITEEQEWQASTVPGLYAPVESLQSQISAMKIESRSKAKMLKGQLATKEAEIAHSQDAEKVAQLAVAQANVATLKEESSTATYQLLEEVLRLRNAKQVAQEQAVALESETATRLMDLEGKLKVATNQVASLQNANDGATAALDDAKSTIVALREEAFQARSQLSGEVPDLCNEKVLKEARATTLKASLECEQLASQELACQLELKKDDIARLANEKKTLQSHISDMKIENEARVNELMGQIASLQKAISDIKMERENQGIALQDIARTKSDEQLLRAKLEAIIKQRDGKVISLENEVSKISLERDELAKKMESLQKEIHCNVPNLIADCDTSQKRANELMSAMESSKELMASMQRQNNDLVLKLEATESERGECINDAELATIEKEEMLTTLETSLKCEQLACEELACQLEVKEDDIVRFANKNKTLQSNILDLTTVNEAQVNELMGQTSSLQEATPDIRREKENQATPLEDMAWAKASEELLRAKLEATIKQRDQQVNALENEVSTMSSERDNLVKKMESLQKELHSSNANLFVQRNTSEERVNELMSAIESYEQLIVSMQRQNDDLVVKLEATESERDKCINEAELTTSGKEKMMIKVKAMETKHGGSTKQLIYEKAELAAGDLASTLLRNIEVEKIATTMKLAEEESNMVFLKTDNDQLIKILEEKEAATLKVHTNSSAMRVDLSPEISHLLVAEEISHLLVAEEAAEARASALKDSVEWQQKATKAKVMDIGGILKVYTNQIESLQNANNDATKVFLEKVVTFNDAKATITNPNEEVPQTMSQVLDEVSELCDEKGALNTRASHHLGEMDDKILRLTRENNDLQCDLSGVSRVREDQVSGLQDMARTKAEEGLLKAKLEATIMQRDQQVNALENEVSRISSERDELVKKMESLQEDLDFNKADLVTGRDTSEEPVNEVIVSMERSKEVIVSAEQEKDDLVLKLEAKESERDECITDAELATSEKDNMLTKVMSTEAIQTDNIKQCTHEIDLLNMQLSQANSHIAGFTNELHSVTAEKEELVAKVESITSDINSIQDEAGTKVSKLELSIESLIAERDAANLRFSEVLLGNKEVRMVLSSLEVEKDELVSSLDANKSSVDREKEKGDGGSQLRSVGPSVIELQSQTTSLTGMTKPGNNNFKFWADAATYNDNVSVLEPTQCMEKLTSVTDEKEELSSDILSKLQLAQSSLRDKAINEAKLNSTIANLESIINQKTEEAYALNEAITWSSAQIAQCTVKISTLTQERDQLIERVEEASAKATALTAEHDIVGARITNHDEVKEAVVGKVKECTARLKSESADAQPKISGDKPELMPQAEKADADYKALESKTRKQEERFKETVANLELSLAEKSKEIYQLNDQLSLLKNQVLDIDSHGGNSNAVGTLKKEILELDSSFSLATTSAETAQTASLSAHQELEEKEIQLNDALRSVAEKKELKRVTKEEKNPLMDEKEEMKLMNKELQVEIDCHHQDSQILGKSENDQDKRHQVHVAELKKKNEALLGELASVNADKQSSQHEIVSLKSEISALCEEKLLLEYKLTIEMQKAQKRKDAAKERRQKFKGKLAGMRDSVKDDLVQLSYQKEY